MKTSLAIATLVAASLACSHAPKSAAEAHDANRDRAVQELADAAEVLDQMTQIPMRHRQSARCVVIIPSLLRAGFVIGARHGEGVASCRTAKGWSAPAFVRMSGGSAGLQIGVESSDVVMLVMTDRGMSQLFRSNFALGADVSASAGPVGEAKEASTDPSLKAEVLSYARSRGLFAGAELSGALIKQDGEALVATYGASPDVSAILAGEVEAPKEAAGLLSKLSTEFPPA